MKAIKQILSILIILSIVSCEKDQAYPEDHFYSELSFADSSDAHPKGILYQAILDDFILTGAPGVSVLISDESGTWLGAGGKADMKSNVAMQPGNLFLIASISKVFTAACIFSFVDEGALSIDDPVSKWIDRSITDKVENAGEAKIRHLLSHTSGIRDYYTINFEMDRYNRESNDFLQEDVLEYVYGKKAEFEVDQYYSYSNTNFLLLGMILEKVSGQSLKEVYEERIFNPLGLQSAYYGTGENKVPDGVAKGYSDYYGKGEYVESDALYLDELGIGGDGGIAINAQDLGRFMQQLMDGNVVSQTSLAQMMDWFEKPYPWNPDETIINGYGLEYFEEEHGVAYGHTGGIDGWGSILHYYPEEGITIVMMYNYVSGTYDIYDERDRFQSSLMNAVFD